MTDNADKTMRWQHFPHKADVGIRGCGPTTEQAFEQAALAMTAVITDPATVEPIEKVNISCRATEDDLLLVDWLNALLYEMDVRKMLFSRFEVKIDRDCLKAVAWGEKTNLEKHSPTVEVKAATYTALNVQQQKDKTWIAQCVVDV